jgi:hypothetical protein
MIRGMTIELDHDLDLESGHHLTEFVPSSFTLGGNEFEPGCFGCFPGRAGSQGLSLYLKETDYSWRIGYGGIFRRKTIRRLRWLGISWSDDGATLPA